MTNKSSFVIILKNKHKGVSNAEKIIPKYLNLNTISIKNTLKKDINKIFFISSFLLIIKSIIKCAREIAITTPNTDIIGIKITPNIRFIIIPSITGNSAFSDFNFPT